MLSDTKTRGIVIQAAALVLFCGLVVGAGVTAWTRMQAQGIAYGFGILARPTGWDISSVFLSQTPLDPYWWVLVVALANTLFVAVVGIVLATVVGFAIGILRHAGNPLLALVLGVYVETFRNIPLILQLVFWYATFSALPPAQRAVELLPDVYLANKGLFIPAFHLAGSGLLAALVLAVLLGLWIALAWRIAGLPFRRLAVLWKPTAILGAGVALALLAGAVLDTDVPEFRKFTFQGGLVLPLELFTIVFAITVFSSAYIAEVVRGGLQSVPKGLWEAAHATGLTRSQAYARVVLPVAVRAILPSLGNQYVFVAKSTALGIAIGFSDIFAVSVVSITQSGQTIEFLVIMMGIYLVLNYSISSAVNFANRRLSLARRT